MFMIRLNQAFILVIALASGLSSESWAAEDGQTQVIDVQSPSQAFVGSISEKSDHDLNTLLEMIVDQARNFTNADAGTLYIMEEDTLRFQIVQNDSLKIRMGGKTGDTIPFPPVELKESNVSAYVAL